MRLIDVDSLKKKAITLEEGCREWEVVTVTDIDNAPTVEAYPFEQVQELVKLNQQFAQEIENLKKPQGEWVEGYHDYFETLDCSECGYVRDDRYKTYNFCPNCGADMRKEMQKND